MTNFQHQVEWPEHARATHAVERHDCLQRQLDALLLQPPLFQSAYLRGYGTLYSAVYRPISRQVELLWPGPRWGPSMAHFEAGERTIEYLR